MQQKRKGTPFIVFGIILMLSGVGFLIGGSCADGNIGSHLDSYFNYGHRDNTGTILSGIGVGCLIIGAAFIVIGIVMYAVSGKNDGTTPQGGMYSKPAVIFSGRYTNRTHTYSVELFNDGKCVWEQKGKHYIGRYRISDDNKWTISIDGYGDAFVFSPIEDGIFVMGGPVNEQFYCEVKW